MFDYIKANQAGGAPFVILERPVRTFQTSFEYSKSGASQENSALPKHFTCYLVDESKAPYDKVTDVDGKEINNLFTFAIDAKNCKVLIDGEAREVTHLEYNYFNYPTAVTRVKADGTEEVVRQKFLDEKYRANVAFVAPLNTKVWDSSVKKEVQKDVKYAKLDIPGGTFARILDTFETVRDTLGEDVTSPIDYPKFRVSYDFDGNAAPADKYAKFKVKALKTPVEAGPELENFKVERKTFEPPATPF